MYILQLSDFHITRNDDVYSMKNKTQKLCDKLKSLLPADSQLLCCLLGDFTDHGTAGSYTLAKSLITELKNILLQVTQADNLEFEIVPGNHDLCEDKETGSKTLSAFNAFSSATLNRRISYSDDTPICESSHFGYHIISVSSVLRGETEFGTIDFDKLNECTIRPNSIMMAHHSLVSADATDNSVIRNGYELEQYLEQNDFLAFLHGHTHGYKRSTIGSNCQIIGVGSLFKDESKYEIWNQCNLINVVGSSIREIKTLTFYGDRYEWIAESTYIRNEDNNYYEKSAYALYSKVLQDADANRLLPNLRIQIKNSFSAFEAEMISQFSAFKEDALSWQNPNCPDSLEFTHYQLMNTSDLTWYDFAIKSLRKNPTSKRTIIPLIDKAAAFHVSDDQYLVSFDVVQLGFTSNECNDLQVTVYMRALEVRHFLPINLYEIYLISKKIRESIQSIENITVCIFAFRAEAKENYGCLKKANIDLMCESKLCKLISDKNYTLLTDLLNEKQHMGDTVIDTSWIVKLYSALDSFYKRENRNEVLQQLEVVSKTLEELKKLRAHCSDYSKTQSEEKAFNAELGKLANLLSE